MCSRVHAYILINIFGGINLCKHFYLYVILAQFVQATALNIRTCSSLVQSLYLQVALSVTYLL